MKNILLAIVLCGFSLTPAAGLTTLPPTLSRFETVIPTTADSSFGVGAFKANRNNQVATLFKPDRNGPDHLLFVGPGLSEELIIENQRFVNLTFSNWGAAILDFAGAGTGIWAAPVGQAPFEVSRVSVSNSTGVINDAGRIALLAREDNSHGNRDIYFRDPGEPRRLLPDLGENEVLESPLIDGEGRLVVRKEFVSPEFAVDVYRFTDGLGWENLTASRLPDNVFVSSSVNSGRERAISLEGDFVFRATRTTPESIRIPEVYLWDDDKQTIEPVLDISSQFTNSSGNPFSLGIEAQFSDAGDLWLMAAGFRAGVAEFRSLYRRGNGDIVDIESLLPSGFELVHDINLHEMNFDGDLWVAARRANDEANTYFFVSGGAATKVLNGVADPVFNPVFTNSHEVYTWLPNAEGRFEFARFQVPEPSSTAMLLLAGMAAAIYRARSSVK